jgi:3-hydroxyisobutyrate dehydrogenase-like beta-hydroxyacid dehydrogenase
MARRTKRNLGIIGLGIIGSRVADHLRRKGLPVFVWNRTPRPVPNFVGSPTELAELCDIIQIFVSDDDAVLEMVQRMKATLNKQHIIVVNSTVSPDTVRAAAEIVERRGGRLVDAPFTGTREAAAKGELVYYLGGDPAALQENPPILETSSNEVIDIGGVGQASAMKIATNIITAAIVQSATEALTLVVDAGVEPEKFALAMRNNGSNSKTLDMKLPKMLAGDFDTQFSVKHMLKDMNIASRIARSLGLDFLAADAARHALQAEERDGRGAADYSSVLHRFFPDGRVKRTEEAAPVEEQPGLTGLHAPVGGAPDEVLQKIFAVPTGAEAGASVAVIQSTGDSESNGDQAVEKSQPVTVAAGEAEEQSGGGLFRRFIRRGDY